jgi:excisionase family DNA binding protein
MPLHVPIGAGCDVNSQSETMTMQPGQFFNLIPKPEAARRLGISVRTLERRIEAEDGPAIVRIGSRVLIPEDSLAAWVSSRTEQPRAA